MITVLEAEAFYAKSLSTPLIDVRSPGEFSKGHIPRAHNIFLFDDDERALLGFLFVKKCPEEAVQKGMDLAGGRLSHYLEAALNLAPERKVCVHCWRGGMRSNSFAELLSENGFEVSLLKGGYKAYRNLVIEAFSTQLPLIVLGGMTGSGKTVMLKTLAGQGLQVLDLEGLAHHKGSVFGAMSQPEQPTTQQFENDLYEAWAALDLQRPVLVEDENYDIGTVKLPYALWQQMRTAPLLQVQVPRERRISSLMAEYAAKDDALLITGIHRIQRRLGTEKTLRVEQAVMAKNYPLATGILLEYYDQSYLASIDKRSASRIYTLSCSGDASPDEMQLLKKEVLKIGQKYYF